MILQNLESDSKSKESRKNRTIRVVYSVLGFYSLWDALDLVNYIQAKLTLKRSKNRCVKTLIYTFLQSAENYSPNPDYMRHLILPWLQTCPDTTVRINSFEIWRSLLFFGKSLLKLLFARYWKQNRSFMLYLFLGWEENLLMTTTKWKLQIIEIIEIQKILVSVRWRPQKKLRSLKR